MRSASFGISYLNRTEDFVANVLIVRRISHMLKNDHNITVKFINLSSPGGARIVAL